MPYDPVISLFPGEGMTNLPSQNSIPLHGRTAPTSEHGVYPSFSSRISEIILNDHLTNSQSRNDASNLNSSQ